MDMQKPTLGTAASEARAVRVVAALTSVQTTVLVLAGKLLAIAILAGPPLNAVASKVANKVLTLTICTGGAFAFVYLLFTVLSFVT